MKAMTHARPGRAALLALTLTATLLVVALPAVAGRNDGSIWRRTDFFANRKATQVGDIVTILINETASAGTQASTKTEETNSQKKGAPWIPASACSSSSTSSAWAWTPATPTTARGARAGRAT